MLESSKALEARVAKLELKTDNSSNESSFADENLMVRAIEREQSAQ